MAKVKEEPITPWSPPKDTRFRRRMIYARHLLLCALLVRRGYPLQTLGERSTGCSWTFCPQGMGPASVVYSRGVGNDVTFERGLVREFGCTVQLLDPSPTGQRTMGLPENQIPQFQFLPLGLAGAAGTLHLAEPLCAAEGSYYTATNGEAAIEVPCVDLKSLMERNQHRQVDLLKLDIEGAEYGVIDQIVACQIPVRQILVEFHDGLLPGVRRRQT